MRAACDFGIDDRWRERLARQGLDDFARLLDGDDVGAVVVRKRKHELRRLTLDGGDGPVTCYLRRGVAESTGRAVSAWLRGERARGGPMREYTVIRRLQRAGIPVMEPIAWGEERRGPLPGRGFLLVRAVEGAEAIDLFRDGDPVLRRRLMAAMGRLLGEVHALGLYTPLRLHDIIVRGDLSREGGFELVLIDRESSRTRPRRRSAPRAALTLARCWCKLREMGFAPTARELAAAADGYRAVDSGVRWSSRRGLWDAVVASAARLAAPGRKYHGAIGRSDTVRRS